MLLKLFTFYYIFFLVFICFFITNCGQQNSGLQKTANPEPVIQLPSSGGNMSTPFPSPITLYDDLKNSAVTSEWDISIENVQVYQNLMPIVTSNPTRINAVLLVRNKQKHSVSFTWEAFIYEAEAQKKIPVNITVMNAKKEKISFTMKANSVKKLELFTREAPRLMGNKNGWHTFMFVIKLTDDANQSVQLRASKLKINTAQ